MKRLILLFFLFVVFSCSISDLTIRHRAISSENITLEDAKEEVYTILESLNSVKAQSSLKHRSIASTWTKSLDANNLLYVINCEDSLGFAFVSNNPQIGFLGIAFNGNICEHDSLNNPGLKIVLSNLETYVKNKIRVADSIAYYTYGDWTDTQFYEPTTGYCPVKWNQGSYSGTQFNAYCPTINGYYCPAGCVAVATAQLMAMYKYPNVYNGYSFNWNSMIANSASQNNQGEYYIARLLQQLGLSQNLNINYSLSGSSAYTSDVPQTLENFGYSNGGTYGFFTNSTFQEMMNGYPIIIRGETSLGEGHSWLGHGVLKQTREIIGYKENGEIMYYGNEARLLVLCNFGWGGIGDGFYLAGAFTTSSGPLSPDPTMSFSINGAYDFPYSIRCVSGIRY